MTTPLLEVCVADATSLAAAIVGGADRVELCSALELGGLTPTPGLLALAAAAPIPVHVLIRPRSGDFVYDDADIAAMLGDIAHVKSLGLAGVVLGTSHPDGSLDQTLLARLVAASAGLHLTLHRAIDLAPDLLAATETAISLGFDTILTSGGQSTAIEDIESIARMHERAAGRIVIMPGSGLTPANLPTLLARVPLSAVHSSCAQAIPVACAPAIRLGFSGPIRKVTTADCVAQTKASIVRG